MVKSKQKQLLFIASEKSDNQRDPSVSSDPKSPVHLLGEDSWMIVKKQKVTIIVPPLLPANPNSGSSQMPNRETELQLPRPHKGPEVNRLSGRLRFIDGGALINRRSRASSIERKIRKAGGLSRWLVSLGLGQFARLFERKRVNRFQLANMTMKRLKEMGADAVGPRRKLMHAIDCRCEPNCFGAAV